MCYNSFLDNRYNGTDNNTNRSRRSAFLQDAHEVETLLQQLEEVNRKLEAIVYNKAGGSSDEHTLRRYHDVLKDYTHEFQRVRELVERQMERFVCGFFLIIIELFIEKICYMVVHLFRKMNHF